MTCFQMTKGRLLVLLVSLALAYAAVIGLRGNIQGKNLLLWLLLATVLFSFGYCVDGSCSVEGFDGECGECGACGECAGVRAAIRGAAGPSDDGIVETMKGQGGGGKHGGGKAHHDHPHPEHHHPVHEKNIKPAAGKHHATVPMKLDKDAVKKPAHQQKKHQKHKPASQNTAPDALLATGKLEDDKHKKAQDINRQNEKRGAALPSQSGLMELDSAPVTININYSNEVDSNNKEKNSNNRRMEVRDVMREISKRQIYPGGGEIVEPCDGDNCVDNRTYNGYCNKGAYQLAQMQREILNLKKKYSNMAYLNDNPYMPMNEEGKRCSVCPLEANGQFASFEGLRKMAQDEPTVNPMMPGMTNRWARRAGNNDPVEDYIPT